MHADTEAAARYAPMWAVQADAALQAGTSSCCTAAGTAAKRTTATMHLQCATVVCLKCQAVNDAINSTFQQ
jgi:hypothetical protein